MSGASDEIHEKQPRMRGEERREFILHRAKGVFARLGYADATTGELARASEVTEPMLYKHFGSKKGLYLAVIKQFGARFLQLWRSRVNRRAEQNLHDALTQVIQDYGAALQEDPEIQKVLLQAVSDVSDPDIAQCLQNHNRNVYLLIHQLLERAQAEDLIDTTIDLNVATWGYTSILLTKQYSLVLNLDHELNKDVLAMMGQIWLRGLRSSVS